MPGVKTVVGVPGRWATHSDLVKAIARDSGGYIFAGMIIMDVATQVGWQAEVYPPDPNLLEAFTYAGLGRLDQETLDAIAGHTFMFYVVGEGGSLEAARGIMRVVCGLLRAGGIAVKVESAGLAHRAEVWQQLAGEAETSDAALYHAYVTRIGQNDTGLFYTCGMHNLGLRDVVVQDALPPREAAALLQTFALYTLLERPLLESGHTFSVDPHAPRYRVLAEPCELYTEDELFFNPFGVWRLSRLT
jgi:Domain of unknown function (DUF4261)